VGMKLNADLERTVLGMSTPAKRPPLGAAPAAIVPTAGPVRLAVVVGIGTPNTLNTRPHHHAAAAMARQQVKATLDALEFARLSGRCSEADRAALALGCEITLRRVCPSPGLADDALAAALKHPRDAVAQWLLSGRIGERDSDKRLVWTYEQARDGKANGVIVTLTRE
jgi:hypothetical protein